MWQLVLVANTTCTARVQRKQQHQIPQDIDWLSCFSPYVPCWTTYIHCYTMVLFESRGFLSDLQFLFTGVPKVNLLARENWWNHVINTRQELWTHNSCASGQCCWFSVCFCSLYTVMLMEKSFFWKEGGVGMPPSLFCEHMIYVTHFSNEQGITIWMVKSTVMSTWTETKM